MPLGTQSHWGWRSLPNSEGYEPSEVLDTYIVSGRKVPYASDGSFSDGHSTAGTWLRANPHRLHLGQVGLGLLRPDGSEGDVKDLEDTMQTLNLWAGLLSSQFKFAGQPLHAQTVCHPGRDLLAIRVESSLLRAARLTIRVAFPYGSTEWRSAADWSKPDRHSTAARKPQHRQRN